jgi:hypothetical protein
MPIIDITTMLGMKPRMESTLLPEFNASLAQDCVFDTGVLMPVSQDLATAVTFPMVPTSIFHYRDEFWFAWDRDVNAIRSPVSRDEYGRIYYTDGLYPKVTTAAIATGGTTRPTTYFRLGIPAPSAVLTVSVITPPAGSSDSSATDDETRFYLHTFVSATGEEGPPSGASPEYTISIPGSSVTLSIPAPQSNNNNIVRRRIYRSATSDSTSGWYKVAELDPGVSTFTDTLTDAQLGAELATEGYLPPPETMTGLCLMANGIAAGFTGNTVLFSEAYLPYAWPEANQLTTEDDVVAICPVATSLVIGTKGYPYIMTGVAPSSITAQKLNVQQACISKRSMVSVDGIVMYASPDGIVAVSVSDGVTVATEQILTRQQWQAMHPATLRAWAYEGKYIGITDSVAFVYDPRAADIVYLSNRWDCAFNDMQSDSLYLAKGTQLYSWKGAPSLTYSMLWRSKTFVHSSGIAYTACRIRGSDLDKAALRILVDGREILSVTTGLLPDAIIRLPACRGYRWQIEVAGTTRIDRITLATSVQELAGG